MGCFWKGAFKAIGNLLRKFPIIGSIIKIAATAICVAVMGPGCGPVMAFLSSAFVVGVQGGSLSQALKAGVIAAVTAVAFNAAGSITGGMDGGKALASGQFGAGLGTTAHIFKIASHAAIGCLSAMAGGGKCGAGAMSAGASAGATPFYSTGSMGGNVAAAALVGGVASKLGGGSFSDGAATAAFGYLFNHLGHMLTGTDADQVLRNHLMSRPGDGQYWSGNLAMGGIFGGGRPDLLYSVDGVNYQGWELKTNEPEAEAQWATRSNLPRGDNNLIFRGQPSITLDANWGYGWTTYTYTPGSQPGIVTYTVNDRSVFDQFLQALGNPQPGIPWLPLGPPGGRLRPR